MSEIHFSYSTLNDLIICSHSWINKLKKIKKPWVEAFRDGKEGHRIIQDHIGGIKADPRIDYLTERFSIVEKTDFDPQCKFEIRVRGYLIIGYLDAHDPEEGKIGEIKLSNSPWSQGKYRESPQRKIYALAFPKYKRGILITGSRKPDEWSTDKLKVRELALTQQDRDEAIVWIEKGLAIFEEGDFNGGLDEEGRCTDNRCPYGNNCHFRSF